MREETALPSYDAKACGEVHINIHVCIACRACYTETMTPGLKGAGASAYICTRLSLHVCGTRGVHRSVRRGSWLSVACRAAPVTALQLRCGRAHACIGSCNGLSGEGTSGSQLLRKRAEWLPLRRVVVLVSAV